MLSKYASNVISAKVRAMYGGRISTRDYNNLIACRTVSDVAVYLKNHTHYHDELANVNELGINRNQLENLIRKKLFHDLESLCRYEISTGSGLTEYTIARTEIEQIIHSLMYLAGGNAYGYIYSLPMFFNKRTKINLMGLVSVKNYDEFLGVLKGSAYEPMLAKHRPEDGQDLDLSAIEKTLYDYLYGKFFDAIKKNTPSKVRAELSETLSAYIDYSNFVRIVRLKRNGSKVKSAVLNYGTIKDRYISQMCKAENEEQVFSIMEHTNRGKKIKNYKYNYVDELPDRVLYNKCRSNIRFSVHPAVIMFSYIFLLQIEIQNLTTIIEGVRYDVNKSELENLLILKAQKREDVV